MGTNRIKRPLARRGSGLTEAQAINLTCGIDLFGDGFGRGSEFDEAAAKAAWERHGERLTADHIRDFPGERPAAWWWWSAPSQRQEIFEPREFDGKLVGRKELEHEALYRMGLLSDDERQRMGEQRRKQIAQMERERRANEQD